MTSEPKAQRVHIINATLALIESTGLSSVTVRAVARAAGVNGAAINYYFGSKDALVATALAGAISHMEEDIRQLLARSSATPVEETLHALGTYLYEGSVRYPEVTKAHLHPLFVSNDVSGPFPAVFRSMFDAVQALVSRERPGLGAARARYRTIRFFSDLLFPVFFPRLFPDGTLPREPADVEVFVRGVVHAALLDEGPARQRPRATTARRRR